MKKYLKPIIELKIAESTDLLCMSVETNKLMDKLQEENIQFGTLSNTFESFQRFV